MQGAERARHDGDFSHAEMRGVGRKVEAAGTRATGGEGSGEPHQRGAEARVAGALALAAQALQRDVVQKRNVLLRKPACMHA